MFHNVGISDIIKQKNWAGSKLNLVLLCSTQKYLNIIHGSPRAENGYKVMIA